LEEKYVITLKTIYTEWHGPYDTQAAAKTFWETELKGDRSYQILSERAYEELTEDI